jgi:hypothetical protein
VDLQHWLTAHADARLIVIDTLARFKSSTDGRNANAYDQDYRDVGAIQTLAARAGVAVLLIHHLRKMAADDPMDQISGTLGITGAADGLMVLARERGSADATLHVTGRDLEDALHAMRWDADTCTWSVLAGDPSLYRQSPERRAILDALKTGLKTPREVAQIVGKGYEAVRKNLQRMFDDGLIGNTAGAYHLPVTPLNSVAPVPGVPGVAGVAIPTNESGIATIGTPGIKGCPNHCPSESQQRRGLQGNGTVATPGTPPTDDYPEVSL